MTERTELDILYDIYETCMTLFKWIGLLAVAFILVLFGITDVRNLYFVILVFALMIITIIKVVLLNDKGMELEYERFYFRQYHSENA